jgi:drug/metabolite transporter (DMT)-like permease
MLARTLAAPPSPSSGAWKVAAGYALIVLIWGTTWYGIRTQVNGTAPHLAAALRMGAAALVFLAIAATMKLPLRLNRAQMAPVLLQGISFFGLNYLGVYAGSQYLTSGVVAVVFSISVPFNILAEWAMNGAQPRAAVIAAAVIGMLGIGIVFSHEVGHAFAGQGAWWGAALVVASAAIVAVGNVLATRLSASELGPVRLNAFGMIAGTGTMLLWGAASGASWSLEITPAWLAGYAYLVLIGTVLAFGIYMKILPLIGSVAGAYVVVLSPIVALGISHLLEGFPLESTTLLGAALLLMGHSMLAARRRRG